MAIGPHKRGQRGIRNSYPVTSGTTAETTKTSDRQINMVPTEGSNVPERYKKLL